MKKFSDLFELTTLVDDMMGENCYILQKKGTQEALIIDPGFQTDLVLELLTEKGLTCDVALITHGHVDHVSGVTKVREAGIDVRMHPADQTVLRLTANILGADNQPITIEGVLDEGTIDWHGIPIEVIHTPGHSQGAVCFLIGDTLFSGDTLFRRSVGRADLPTSSWDQLVQSIQGKLFALPPEVVVLPGHGEPTTIAEEKADNPFVSPIVDGAAR